MKELTKESVRINNQPEWTFRLHCDDKDSGIIRMSKGSKSKTITITRRDVPITTPTKWRFYELRSGFIEHRTKEHNFIGSYMDKDNPHYNEVKNYMSRLYTVLKNAYTEENEENVDETDFNRF